MKTYASLLIGACFLLNSSCMATSSVPTPAGTPVAVAVPSQPADQLEQLVAPIALYPDVLVALILPAATEISDLVLAARYLSGGGDPQQVDAQGWDESVTGLAHYPEVVKWMDENLAWTREIGDAYAEKPDAVMTAVQRARARALANGALVNTPQQQVLVENGIIRIVPAQAQVIYVPRYDPEIIYVDRLVYHQPDLWLTFGVGFSAGWWLRNDCDWGRRTIVVNHWHRDRWRHDDWYRHHVAHRPGHHFDHDWKPWTPHPGRPHHFRRDYTRPNRVVVHPRPLPGTPRIDRPDRRPGTDRDQDRGGKWSHRPDRRDRSNDGSPANLNPVRTVPRLPATSAVTHAPRPVPPADDGSQRRWRDRDDRRNAAPAVRPNNSAPTVNAAPAVRPPRGDGGQAHVERMRQSRPENRPSAAPVRSAPQVVTRAPAVVQERVQSVRSEPVARVERSERSERSSPRERSSDDGNRGGRGRPGVEATER